LNIQQPTNAGSSKNKEINDSITYTTLTLHVAYLKHKIPHGTVFFEIISNSTPTTYKFLNFNILHKLCSCDNISENYFYVNKSNILLTLEVTVNIHECVAHFSATVTDKSEFTWTPTSSSLSFSYNKQPL